MRETIGLVNQNLMTPPRPEKCFEELFHELEGNLREDVGLGNLFENLDFANSPIGA